MAAPKLGRNERATIGKGKIKNDSATFDQPTFESDDQPNDACAIDAKPLGANSLSIRQL